MDRLPDVSVSALRRLAQGLLYDRHGAEDVVQEAWLAALCARPEPPRLGAWLSEAVKRLARNRRREEARRRAREERAARSEALPGADERSAQIEILHRLLDALQRLDEPYRSAVMLRYLDDLPPREIGRRMEVPVNTARTHVRRGLERLRRDLDGERGRGREELLAALVPFAGELPWSVAWRGGTLVQGKAWLAGAIGILIAVSWLVLRGSAGMGGAESESSSRVTIATSSDSSESSPAAQLDKVAAREREPVASSTAALNATWVVRGHAFAGRQRSYPHLPLIGRVHGGPEAEGVPVVEARFATDEAGDFAWAIEPPSDLVTVSIAPDVGGHVTEGSQDVFLPGDPAPERWTVGAYVLDATVRGVVRDPTGRPVPGARVQSLVDSKTTTDEAGRYSLRIHSSYVPWFGDEQLSVSATGFASTTLTLGLVAAGEIEAPDIFLQPEQRVHGRVIDQDGAAVEGAKVFCESNWDRTVLTDEHGVFDLGELDPSERNRSLAVTKPGHVTVSQELDPLDLESEIVIRLARAVQIRGRILAPDAALVWGAVISIGDLGLDPYGGPCCAYSDREGRFMIDDVAPGRRRFWLERSGFAKTRVDVTVRREETFEVELSFDGAGHFLAGVVVDDQDLPVPWARVEVSNPRDFFLADYADTHTGSDGRFRVDGLPAKRVSLRVHDGDLVRIDEVIAELDRDDLVLRMRPTSFLAGMVIEADTGVPVPSFLVHVDSPAAELVEWEGRTVITYPRPRRFSSTDGRWSMEAAEEPGHPFSLKLEADGHVTSTVELVRTSAAASPDDLVIRMVRSTKVIGRVLEKHTGAPIAETRLRRLTPGQDLVALDNSFEPVFECTSDQNGRFEITDVPLGAMLLAVEAPGRGLVVDGPFEVNDSTTIQRTIELGPGATICGHLLDAGGNGLNGLTIELEALDGAQQGREWQVQTDQHGRFSFTGLPSGLFALNWARYREDEWIYWLRERIEVSADACIETVLQPRGRATLCGSLEFDGELPERDSVWVAPVRPEPLEPARVRWSRTSWSVPLEHGRFCLDHLEPGEYEVSAEFDLGVIDPEDPFDEGDGYAYGEARVIVPEEGTVEVRVLMERHEY